MVHLTKGAGGRGKGDIVGSNSVGGKDQNNRLQLDRVMSVFRPNATDSESGWKAA